MGLPINYGVSPKQQTSNQQQQQFVNEAIGGLTIPSPLQQSQCPSNITKALLSYESVGFGYDISSGCSLSLNRQELADLCCQGTTGCGGVITNSPYSDHLTGIPHFFNAALSNSNSDDNFVGIFGNSDPLDISQWYKLTLTAPSTSNRAWDDKTGICYNMFSG